MAIAIYRERKTRTSSRISNERSPVETHELVAVCPKCKTLEVLWFSDGRLEQTRKFNQSCEQVYHDCGAKEPCRLYRFSQVKAPKQVSGY
jgi:phage FluMu protein Com